MDELPNDQTVYVIVGVNGVLIGPQTGTTSFNCFFVTLRYQIKIKYMKKVFFQGAICKNWTLVALVFTPIAQELWTRMGKGASWLAC